MPGQGKIDAVAANERLRQVALNRLADEVDQAILERRYGTAAVEVCFEAGRITHVRRKGEATDK